MRLWDALVAEHDAEKRRRSFLLFLYEKGRIGDWVGTLDDDGAPWTHDPDIRSRRLIEPSWRHTLGAIRGRPRC